MTDLADQLERLADLREAGQLGDDRYNRAVDFAVQEPEVDVASSLERIIKLYAAGKLTEQQRDSALDRTLNSANTPDSNAATAHGQAMSHSVVQSAALTGVLTCPACGHNEPSGTRFCSHCGNTLASPCPLCTADNKLDTRFCKQCGTEIEKVPPGLTLPRAEEWRESWGKLGWWDDPFTGPVGSLTSELLSAAGLSPNSDVQEDYWLLSSRLSNADWRISRVQINSTVLPPTWRLNQLPCYLVATRSRFIMLDLPGHALHAIPFQYISRVELTRQGADLIFDDGSILKFSVNAKGPGRLDRSRLQYWSWTDNTAERYLAGQVVGAKQEGHTQFLEVVEAFITEIAEVGRLSCAIPPRGTVVLSVSTIESGAKSLPGTSLSGSDQRGSKCANCGHILNSFSLHCPSCSYVLSESEQRYLAETLIGRPLNPGECPYCHGHNKASETRCKVCRRPLTV